MLTVTDSARERITELLDDFGADGALRVALQEGGSPLAPHFELELVERQDREPGDVSLDVGGMTVFADAASAPRLQDAIVDFAAGVFELALPAAADSPGDDLAARVAAVLEQRVNPAVAAHGGRIALAGVQDNVVYVRMSGGCQGCGLAAVTLRQGVERMLREAVPEIAGVRDVTDHADGRNPFYGKE